MFHQAMEAIKGELSGARAFRHVEEIIRHHRIQASPGYRDAAKYCCAALTTSQVQGQILSYPANFATEFWSQIMMQEWACDLAELKLIAPEEKLLASFDECKISLIQRSGPTPVEGVTADVFVLDRGDDPQPYQTDELRGKVVLTDGDLNKVRKWAVEEKGAIGILSDRLAEFPPVRHRYDIPDARQYTSFWWAEGETPCFGFVLSPKLGDYLRRLSRQAAARHQADPRESAHVQVHAQVSARFYDGAIENVSGFIPGTSDEEILITAHLCHPQWSANDNASGVAVALETARAVNHLIAAGKLPQPKRGIRILLIPEMTGTYAYLATNQGRIPKTLAALNMDMVGEKQELCKGPLVAEHPPAASESFVGDLLDAVMIACAKEAPNLAGTGRYGLFKYTSSPFSGGSDHYILSDPSVNIPCPMLIQWPDKYYHTSEDTIDKVDAEMLYRVGIMAATYAYFLACADLPEAIWLAGELRARFLSTLAAFLQEQLGRIASEPYLAARLATAARKQLDYRLERRRHQIRSIGRFVANDGQDRWIQLQDELLTQLAQEAEGEWGRFIEMVAALGMEAALEQGAILKVDGEDLIPIRAFPGPLSMRGHVERLEPQAQEEYRQISQRFGADALRTTTCALYWADGKRTIREICDLVELEMGVRNVPFMVSYLQSLAQMGLVTLK